MPNQSSIQTILTRNIILTAMISLGLFSLVWVQDEYSTFRTDSELLRKNYVEEQKRLLKSEVGNVLAYVQYMVGHHRPPLENSNFDEVTKEIQDEVLKRIVTLRFDQEGYFFGSTYQGQALFSNGRITKEEGSILDLTDPNGVKIIQEQQKTIKNQGDGFISYSWKKLASDQPSPKISYVIGIPEWQWIIGAGIYLDTIEETISRNEKTLQSRLQNKVLKSVLLLLVLFTLVLYWAGHIAKQVQSGIQAFSSFFKKAATQSAQINPAELFFVEFREIAASASQMLQDRNQSEKERRTAQILMESIIEQSPIPMVIATPDGILKAVNPACRAHFGITDEPGLQPGINLFTMQPSWKNYDCQGNLIPVNQIPLAAALQGKTTRNMEMKTVRHDGIEKWAMVNSAPIYDNRGGLLAGFVTFADITEHKQAEEEKEQLQKQIRQAVKMQAVGTLAGGIAHEFNNLLGIIMGCADLARDEVPKDSFAASQLENLLKAAHRARDLVKKILTFSRQAHQKRISANLGLLVEEAIQLIQSSLPSSVEIKILCNSADGNTLADPTEIQQIIMNLCSNAVWAMQEKGTIEIHLDQVQLADGNASALGISAGDYIKLSFSDNGQGMDNETRSRIFDPFYTRKEVGQGTGMGLSIVYAIMESYGGTITVESEIGKGTSFHLYFLASVDPVAIKLQ